MTRSVLITGAAGGIGRRIVARFAELGWTVFASDLAVAGFGALPNIHPLLMDVTSEPSVQAAREQVGAILQGAALDVLINNAGVGPMGPITETRDEDARLMFEVNVLGPIRVTRAFTPQMAARGQGRVVTVGSLAGIVTLPFLGAYCASKHGAEAVSDAMRLELKPLGINVSLVQPAIVDTPFVVKAIGALDGCAGSPWQEAIERTRALRGTFQWTELDPDRVARTVVQAALSRWPRARYPVGALSALLIRLLKLTPTFLGDAATRLLLRVRARAPARRESPARGSVVS